MTIKISMSDNRCEWGDGRQCPELSLEDGSIFGQYCALHARQEAYLIRQEFGNNVCLWCAHTLPDPDECEFGEHTVIPNDYPAARPADIPLFDTRTGRVLSTSGNPDVWGWQS